MKFMRVIDDDFVNEEERWGDRMSENTTTRVTIRVSNEVHEWFKLRSEKTGVASSALMYLALEQHIQQNNALIEIPRMLAELKKMQE